MLGGDKQNKGKMIGREDCLYLNVYAPIGATPTTPLPTMVWLYGGTFLFGAGSSYDASVLAEQHASWW